MSDSPDYFSRGIARASERHAKEKARQQITQIAQNIDSGAAITITQLDRDEQYRITTIKNMLDFIKRKKEEVKND
ncbi:hypothetical protein [Pseudomonas moraviensis]|uniref:hypothetical protein n=1 Tax=Pseudomonas moraviensis TaxID=321662 RepID=UPI00105A690C|nr:hypothetical protein [Pseudomonas moraviensis]TDK53497.1 hypothetical protein E1508_18075 [Pseudomonas moraviensis]